ncbi:hypothetical protein PF011_g18046 [Phytophthora fragariae]|uniref:Uncharacterized protein n=1 Tax=Phytophthora fragariae TaxID=53985 RepID=A0A6A3JCM4_9STRA|nr:hypothetical protein PF003_g39492 [Phytophthora fragariae]KAE8991178.1 hypothetical protein PF011_g18046 [Phytophthora fragariae]
MCPDLWTCRSGSLPKALAPVAVLHSAAAGVRLLLSAVGGCVTRSFSFAATGSGSHTSSTP